MRVLMLCTPVPTHLAPQIPLAWALRGSGHEVLLAGQPDIAGLATSAGLCFQTVGEPFCVDELLVSAPGVRAAHAGRPEVQAMGAGARVWMNHARYVTGPYAELIRRFDADLVVADRLEYGALIAAHACGVPIVQHRWGVDVIACAAQKMAERMLAGLAQRFGLDGLPEPALVLDPAPASLQTAIAPPAVPIRYVPFNGPGTRPPWADHPTRERRVCVSLGTRTIELNGMPMIHGLVGALAQLPDVEGVITMSAAMAEQLGRVPDNVSVVEPVPLHAFLPSCSAVVHHGGAGTIMTAAAAGLPHLVLPQLLDMWEAADLVVAARAGVSIEDAAEQESDAVLHTALVDVLGGAFDDGARTLAADIAAAPSPLEVVGDLERLVGERAPTPGTDRTHEREAA